MDSSISEQRVCRVRTARLALWLDGEPEFPQTFQQLSRTDQDTVCRLVGEITNLLDSQVDPVRKADVVRVRMV